jgi:hypothetical protein
MLLMIDHRLLGDPIDLEDDLVTGAARNDLDPPLLAAQGVRHRDDRLQRVALPPAVRCDVGLAAGGPGREVQDAGDRLRRDIGAVVAHPDPAARHRDMDHRRDAGFLSAVQTVVDAFLDDDQRPGVGLVAGLGHQLLARAEFE